MAGQFSTGALSELQPRSKEKKRPVFKRHEKK